jgi:hypothetical protein
MALPAATTVRGAQNTGTEALTGGTSLSSMVVRLFAGFTEYLDPTETPFSSSVDEGRSVNQKKIEWGTGFLSPNKVTLGATLASGGGNVTLTLAAGDGAKVQLTDVLRITSVTGVEHVWVTAIATDTLTVSRGIGGTSALQHTLAAPAQIIEILGPAGQENADSPIAPITKGALEYNLPQLFDYAVQVSNREDATPDYEFDGASRYDAYLARVMKNAAIDFEKSMIMGKRGAETSMVVGSGLPTFMGGLDFFTDRRYDLAGVAISESAFRTMQRDLWKDVGENRPDTFISGGFLREAISSLWNANRYATVTDEKTTLVWDSVKTEYGTIRFLMSRYIMDGYGFYLNLKDIKKHPYKNGVWAEVALATQGPYKKGRFTGDYTSSWRNNAARAAIVNASTLASDYTNL